jgi:hypothetical protein
MIEEQIQYKAQIHFGARILEAIAQMRKLNGYSQYGDRTAHWSTMISRLNSCMREMAILEKYQKHLERFPEELVISIQSTVASLFISFAEFFDALSDDPDADLSLFINAYRTAEPNLSPDIDENDAGESAAVARYLEMSSLAEAIRRVNEGTNGVAPDEVTGGYL